MKKLFWLLTLATSLGGCASTPASFFAQHKPYTVDAEASLQGVAGVRIENGTFLSCNEVVLFPRTPYYEERLTRSSGNLSAKEWSLSHKTACDPQGHYLFSHLPEAPWIMVALGALPQEKPKKHPSSWFLVRNAQTRNKTQDDVFLYASFSPQSLWDSRSFVPDQSLQKTLPAK